FGHIVIQDRLEGARFEGLGNLGENNNWNSGEYQGIKSFSMRPGDEFALMLIPNGRIQEVLNNPNITGTKAPIFSLGTDNPYDMFHFGQIADVTGDGSTFVMEDVQFGHAWYDGDYNDLIFQVRGATGEAPLMADLMDPALDWRDSDLGQALVSYATRYVEEVGVEDIGFSFSREYQPLIGIIDTGFSGDNPDLDYSNIMLGRDWIDGDDNPLLSAGEGNEHGTHILGIIAAQQDNDIGIDGINPDAPIWLGRAVGSGQWANSLVEFVDAAVESGQPNAVVNLSLDLTQIDANGEVFTRYEFTPMERAAIEYARQNNVLLVVAAGNDGGVMSALGQASQEFDNIITVGAAEQFDPTTSAWKGADRTDYSSYGYGLDLMAYGGTEENPHLSLTGDSVGAMAGTSVATAKVTGAVSQVWAANPALSYRQVIDILKQTATDLGETGFDLATGAGLVNMMAAVHLAKVTKPEEHFTPHMLIPETWSGEGVFTAGDRAVAQKFWKDGKYYDWVPYQIKREDTLSHLALKHLGNAGDDYYMWIAQKNGIADPNRIFAGDWIQVPQLVSAPINPIAQRAIQGIYEANKARLGKPTSEPVNLGNGFLQQTFEGGHITWNGQQAIPYFTGTGLPIRPGLPIQDWSGNRPVVSQVGFDGKITHSSFVQAFNQNGGFWGVGRPTEHVKHWERGLTQQFTGGQDRQGAIMQPDGSSRAYWVGGDIWREFLNRGGAKYVGYPKTNAIPVKGGLDKSGGKVQHFLGNQGIPSKIWSSKHGAHPTWGAIGGRYDQMGGPASWLGFPTSGEYGIGSGWVKQDFEGGYMLWHPHHGTTVYNTKAVDSLPPDSGNGSTGEWTVKYWNNTNLSGTPVWTMTEPPGEIRFNAGSGAPVGTQGIKEDNFSARWETTSYFKGGFYDFISQADDGVRVYVNGVKIIDKWTASRPWSLRNTYMPIPEGNHKIVVEYFEKTGIAGQILKWEPSQNTNPSSNITIRPGSSNITFSRGQTWITSTGYRFRFLMDGNLVLVNPAGKTLWATGTNGTGANKFAVQKDGNVVLYHDNKPLWATNTSGNPGTYFAIQNDGNLVVYSSDKKPIFNTGTHGGRQGILDASARWLGKSEPGYVNSNVGSVPLNMRSAASLGAGVMRTLNRNTSLKILRSVTGGAYTTPNGQTRSDWYEVEVNGQKGFVAAYYVTKGNPPNNGGGGSSAWQHPLPGYPVTSEYGWRRDPFTGQQKFHYGIDFGTSGTTPPVKAAQSGKVVFAGWNNQGYGNLVIIEHPGGIRTYYAHLSSISVRTGQQVTSGAKIGNVGSTGFSTGPHLHFEVRVSPYRWQTDNRNPRNYIRF
ncbi:S8 family serine peptidase, partial [Spirulina subsalsa FACHB-351]